MNNDGPRNEQIGYLTKNYPLTEKNAGLVLDLLGFGDAVDYSDIFFNRMNLPNNYFLLGAASVKNKIIDLQELKISVLESTIDEEIERYHIDPGKTEIETLDKEGKLKEVKSRSKNESRTRLFTFHPTDLAPRSDYLGRTSSHYYEHISTKDP